MKILILLLTIYSIKSCTDCNTVLGKVKLQDNRFKMISVSLEGANRTTFVDREGSFIFHNVPNGLYIVFVNDYFYQYEPILVEVSSIEVKAYQYSLKIGKGLKHKYPFEITPTIKIKYEEDSPNIIESVVKSPYAIIIGITLVLFLCMQMVPQDQLKEQMEQFNSQMSSMRR